MNKCEDRRCNRQNKPDHWHLELNAYQRDNLLALLMDYIDLEPFTMLDTGDWRRELVWLLDPDVKHSPNVNKEGMQSRINKWLERQK